MSSQVPQLTGGVHSEQQRTTVVLLMLKDVRKNVGIRGIASCGQWLPHVVCRELPRGPESTLRRRAATLEGVLVRDLPDTQQSE